MSIPRALYPLIPSWELVAKRPKENVKANRIDFTAGKKIYAALDQGDVLSAVMFQLYCTLTTAGSPSGTVRPFQPWDLVDEAGVAGPGGDIIRASGLALHVLNHLRLPQLEQREEVSAAEHAVGSQTYEASGRLRMAFNEPNVRPFHYGLLCTGLKAEAQYKAFIKWATGVTNLVDSTNGTFGTSPYATVNSERLMGVQPPLQGYGLHYVENEVINPTATQVRNVYNLRRGRYLHWILLIARQGSTLLPSDSVLTSSEYIRIKKGGQVIAEKTVLEWRALLRQLLPGGWPSYAGILAIPVVQGEAKDSSNVNTQAVYLPTDVECTLEYPTTGAATNALEVVQVSREDVDVAAAAQGLNAFTQLPA